MKLKCPKCGKMLDYLMHFASGEMCYIVQWDGGKLEYEQDQFLSDYKSAEYECPHCSEVIFTSDEDAEKFLLKKEEADKNGRKNREGI